MQLPKVTQLVSGRAGTRDRAGSLEMVRAPSPPGAHAGERGSDEGGACPRLSRAAGLLTTLPASTLPSAQSPARERRWPRTQVPT